MSDVNQSEAGPHLDRSEVLLKASRNPRQAARAMLDSYMRNLAFRAELAQIRRGSFTAALRRQQEVVQDMLEQVAAMEGRTPAQRDAVTRGLERRLAAIRNFAEITEASNQQFFEAADRRMADWCAEIGRSMLGIEDGAAE
jgi:hypothetical protein